MRKIMFLLLITVCLFSSCEMNVSSVNFSAGEVIVITEPQNTYYSGYWPDGKLNLVKKDGNWQMFWAEAVDILTVADSPWPEDHYSQLKSTNIVFGKGKSSIKNINENGSWFIGVHPLDDSGNYAGFFHGESHWDSTGIAYKTIGVAYSSDYGKTWTNGNPVITSDETKPESPQWSGVGDGTVVWDHINKRWLCFYQGQAWNFAHIGYSNKICMAASYDEKGAPGTWKKWNGFNFSREGCNQDTLKGGENGEVRGLSSVPGCNPSVMWNDYLNKWVMAYASWGKEIYLSFSDNGTAWSKPVKVLGSEEHPVWYPNLISIDGDKTGGQSIRMYFSYDQGSDGKRKLAYCTITF